MKETNTSTATNLQTEEDENRLTQIRNALEVDTSLSLCLAYMTLLFSYSITADNIEHFQAALLAISDTVSRIFDDNPSKNKKPILEELKELYNRLADNIKDDINVTKNDINYYISQALPVTVVLGEEVKYTCALIKDEIVHESKELMKTVWNKFSLFGSNNKNTSKPANDDSDKAVENSNKSEDVEALTPSLSH